MSRSPEEIISNANAWAEAFWHGRLSPHGDHGAIIEVIDLADRLREENTRLRTWKAESLTVLAEWESTWEACGSPGFLGQSKAKAVRLLFENMTAPNIPAVAAGRSTGNPTPPEGDT